MSSPIALKYRAFLSYAHADTRWAKWLHGRLEGFRIDKDLVGRDTEFGSVPKTLRPIFRDREDFSGGHTLTEATIAALDASAALIVLCSTASALRPAVNEEVRLFRTRHPDRPVIPVIIEGSYPDNFPPALRYEVTADGTVTERPVTFLAPDLRDEGDGRELAVAKVAARLIGQPPDEVFRRAERARRRSANIRNGITGVLALLVVAAGLSAYLFREELKRNEALLDRTLERATNLVNKTVLMSDQFGMPRALSRALLLEAERMFADVSELGSESPKLLVRKARMLIEFARTSEVLGQSADQRNQAVAAEQLMARLLAREPDNLEAMWYRASALTELGDALSAQGFTQLAFQTHESALRIMYVLYQKRRTTLIAFGIRASLERLGRIDALAGNISRAIEAARMSLTIAEALSAHEPDNINFRRSLSAAHTDLGDLFLAVGSNSTSLDHQQKALAINQVLALAEPSSNSAQAALGISHERTASLHGAMGDFRAALQNYNAARAITDRLASADPTNAIWQHNICVILGMIGDTYLALGQFSDAKTAYVQSLGIRIDLTNQDPANASWQFDLASNYYRLALTEILSDVSDSGRAIEIARGLYALKHSVNEDELARFAKLSVGIFTQSSTNKEAGQQLAKATTIVREIGGAGKLPAYFLSWGQIYEAAHRAIVEVRQ